MMNIETTREYKDGDIIIKEGSHGEWVCVILSGKVEVFRMIRGKKFTIDILGEGEILGELSFIDGAPRFTSARAVGDVKVGIINKIILDDEFNKLSKDFKKILITLVSRLRKTTERINTLSGREFERAQKRVKLEFKSEETFLRCYSKNLGGGGLFIKTENPLLKDSEFPLSFKLPGDPKPIDVKCKVIWINSGESPRQRGPKGMGVKFLDLNEEDSKRIEHFVEREKIRVGLF